MMFFVRLIGVLMLSTPAALTQICPKGPVNSIQLFAALDSPQDANVVYRVSAIAGSAILSKLRSIAQPNRPVDSVEGAAQIALAKLGDQNAIQELGKELAARRNNQVPIEKLIRVRNDAALSILMDYFVLHENDMSRIVDHGDYVYDPLVFLMTELRKILPVLPNVAADAPFSQQLRIWSDWWDQHRDVQIFSPLDKEFADPYLKCLARKVDWGFPDAILDISSYDEKTAAYVFRKLIPPNLSGAFKLHTLDGNVQTALAKAGDDVEMRNIGHELHQISVKDAIDKLRFIGDRRAVDVLIGSLDISQEEKELRKFYSTRDSERVALDFQKTVLYTLGKLVKNPPLPPDATPGAGSGGKWVAWWGKEKNSAALNPFPPNYFHE